MMFSKRTKSLVHIYSGSHITSRPLERRTEIDTSLSKYAAFVVKIRAQSSLSVLPSQTKKRTVVDVTFSVLSERIPFEFYSIFFYS